MTLLPPLSPAYGEPAVSPATTRTASWSSPKASAAIDWKTVSVPLMSTAPVTMVRRPSASRRQLAAAGSRPPGHQPRATPTPSPSGSSPRRSHSGCARRRSRHSAAPKTGKGLPSRPGSPSRSTLRSRSSMGSRPSSAASSSIERLDREGGRRRRRRAVGAEADAVGEHAVGGDVARLPAVGPEASSAASASKPNSSLLPRSSTIRPRTPVSSPSAVAPASSR